jgi:hypothetical protein
MHPGTGRPLSAEGSHREARLPPVASHPDWLLPLLLGCEIDRQDEFQQPLGIGVFDQFAEDATIRLG